MVKFIPPKQLTWLYIPNFSFRSLLFSIDVLGKLSQSSRLHKPFRHNQNHCILPPIFELIILSNTDCNTCCSNFPSQMIDSQFLDLYLVPTPHVREHLSQSDHSEGKLLGGTVVTGDDVVVVREVESFVVDAVTDVEEIVVAVVADADVSVDVDADVVIDVDNAVDVIIVEVVIVVNVDTFVVVFLEKLNTYTFSSCPIICRLQTFQSKSFRAF